MRGVTGSSSLTRIEQRRQARDQRRPETDRTRTEGRIRRLMKENVLYLLIAEMSEASRQELDSP
ncbi:hypothetical protein BZG36_01941 [Bifiguratus adelaidae]|uniref:Uncharacterized protein n=1 Tax=Bifiguratus adelaidae TaxID=1938954 RepID=A0A261Y3T8_9FUNG|nr:hypothetical protein BZG36_01941 [Bifiguratus adelaidae]